jgi:hypothetical protein
MAPASTTTSSTARKRRCGSSRASSLALILVAGCAHQAPVQGGEVDRAELAKFVRRQSDAIRNCYELELKRDSSLKGTIVLRFTILPTGEASDVGVESDTMGEPAVAGCLEALTKGWAFPFRPAAPTVVAYPFAFGPKVRQ